MQNLGRLEKVDLRDIWPSEAGHFTPWLASENNITLLGETIGVELEVETQEKDVGPFRADILCRDTANNNWVLVENQLEQTNHNHLGQLLTYAAGLEAVMIVWVAQHFTEEHRAALDWLNEKTDEDVNFFGLEIELWKIGDSEPAPKFNVISKPNDWSRTVKETAKRTELTETQKLQLDYWTAFKNYMEESNSFLKCQKPYPQNWLSFSIGRSNFSIVARINTRDNKIGVFLCIGVDDATSYFKTLEGKYKKHVEQQMDMKLNWRELPDAKESHLEVSKEADPTDRKNWEEQHKWLKEKIETFHKVLSPIIRELDADELNDLEEV